MKYIGGIAVIALIMSACIPGNVKEKMKESMSKVQEMAADMEFKKAIGAIELHKLRNGAYPNSLAELEFLTAFDSSMTAYVEYTRLDSVYELNLKMEFPSLDGKETKAVALHYPPEFWNGLGCVKSNVK